MPWGGKRAANTSEGVSQGFVLVLAPADGVDSSMPPSELCEAGSAGPPPSRSRYKVCRSSVGAVGATGAVSAEICAGTAIIQLGLLCVPCEATCSPFVY